jgi:hypothetical protein
MLASTVQFSSYGRSRPWFIACRCPRDRGHGSFDEGWSLEVLSEDRPVPQDPTACRSRLPAPDSRSCRRTGCTSGVGPKACQLVNVPPLSNHRGTDVLVMALDGRPRSTRQVLLRKEVIQPHLPVRLPCYDFVPIADPTFDSSLLAVGPLASGVTNFRDVTGGVYKARERIHRSVADLRLLATPTSWGRVADPNPN